MQVRDDVALLALNIIAKFYEVDVDLGTIIHRLAHDYRSCDSDTVVKAAALIGLRAKKLVGLKGPQLSSLPRPAILRMTDGAYFVLNSLPDVNKDTLHDPLDIRARIVSAEKIASQWSGEAILITKGSIAETDESAFGWKWLLKLSSKYKRPLTQVLICSLFLQLFALITPLLFQVVVDKVLVHKSIATLEVVAITLLALGLFDVTLQYLRSYVLYHTASRIDVDLGAQVFRRLFRLPVSYFESRPTGQTVARVRELENIRSFLTGQAITSLIDAVFTIIFLAVLFYYSTSLALIVVAALPFYLLTAAVVRPILRNKVREKFNRGAISQQYLVESTVGALTLKAAAVEPILQRQWEEKLASYVVTSFQAVMTATTGQLAVQYISKAMTAAILFFGAEAVISGELSVGQLIAFNMIAGQLVAPTLRLSQLWQDFQQMKISLDRLGDIFRADPEEGTEAWVRIPENRVNGRIAFDSVTFRYAEKERPVLNRFSLEIPQGQTIGIVGPSGSGKSTLTKLVQRLLIPEAGRVTIDGRDISGVPPSWFRKQIGVVLQENILFNRTIHENIALSNPGMSRQAVIAVAQLAGADEFIQRLPQGYDTQIQERGANLSGGQRQRIAIARALATSPRVLILDEATSALDYESEKIIQDNMRQIVHGRTVIIVAHRLVAVRQCDRIISLSDGRILEDGSHAELLKNENGLYQKLWKMQSSSAELSAVDN